MLCVLHAPERSLPTMGSEISGCASHGDSPSPTNEGIDLHPPSLIQTRRELGGIDGFSDADLQDETVWHNYSIGELNGDGVVDIFSGNHGLL